MENRRLFLGVAARLRGCNISPEESLHSSTAYRLQLEVLESEMLMLPRLAGALAGAMQIGHEDFDLDSLGTVVKQAHVNMIMGIPYAGGPGGTQSAQERERSALIERARKRRDNLLKNIEGPPAAEAPKITVRHVGKKNANQSST